MIPAANCSVFGCGSCRRSKEIGIFKPPVAKDEAHRKWRKDWLGEVAKSTRLSGSGSKTTKCTLARNISNPRILKYVSIALFSVTL